MTLLINTSSDQIEKYLINNTKKEFNEQYGGIIKFKESQDTKDIHNDTLYYSTHELPLSVYSKFHTIVLIYNNIESREYYKETLLKIKETIKIIFYYNNSFYHDKTSYIIPSLYLLNEGSFKYYSQI